MTKEATEGKGAPRTWTLLSSAGARKWKGLDLKFDFQFCFCQPLSNVDQQRRVWTACYARIRRTNRQVGFLHAIVENRSRMLFDYSKPTRWSNIRPCLTCLKPSKSS